MPETISTNPNSMDSISHPVYGFNGLDTALSRLPVGVAIIDQNYNIVFWNNRLAEISRYSSAQATHKNLLALFPKISAELTLGWLDKAFQGDGFAMEPVYMLSELSRNAPVWIKIVPATGSFPLKTAILTMDYLPPAREVSPSLKDVQGWQIWMMYEITQILQNVHSLEEKLYIILTALTAGEGFGFNRAALFLIDEHNMLRGQMGIGPDSAEEAGRIWEAVRSEGKTLYDYIELHFKRRKGAGSAFDRRVRATRIPLDTAAKGPLQCISTRRPFLVKSDTPKENIEPQISQLLKTAEFACVPLLVKQKVTGIILVDNAFTSQAIRDEDLKTLLIFANQAGIAIENARLYESLNEKINALASANEKLDWVHDRIKHYDSFAAMGRLAAGVAHEIRNPLNAISLNLEIIKDAVANAQLQDRQEVFGSIDTIYKEVLRMEELVSEFIDYARPSRIELRQADLNDVLTKLMKIVKPMVSANNINLVTNFQAQIPSLLLDEDQFKQALFNIILNAIQAMPNGGTLTVSTRLPVRNTANPPGGISIPKAVIQVKDEGAGISAENMPHIFEPFFSTKTEGTGLGLSIVERIVHRHGGEIEVSSQPGHGTVVEIYLPVEGMSLHEGEEER